MTWAGVIGSPIAHSLSPVLHRAAWRSLDLGQGWDYLRLEQTEETLPGFIEGLGQDCLGLSVTMPCKQAVIPLLDVIDPMAQAVGAVNTVIPGGGVLTGFNTDVHGIVQALREAREARGLDDPSCAVILGTRATASSALAALGHLHVPRTILVGRRFGGPGSATMAATRLGLVPEQVPWARTDAVLEAIAQADVVVSTMPAGVCDGLAERVDPRGDQTLLDVVYAPWETALVQRWSEAGAIVAHGSEMLLHQAAQQVRLMTGRYPRVAPMRHAMLSALEQTE